MSRRPILVVLTIVGGAACNLLSGAGDLVIDDDLFVDGGDAGDGDSSSGDGGREDGGATDAADAGNDASVVDAGRDASIILPDGGCGLPTNETFAAGPNGSLSPHWHLYGAATQDAVGIRFTDGGTYQSGVAVYDIPLTFDAIAFDVEFSISASSPAGDGIAVAWLDTTTVPASNGTAGASQGLGTTAGLAASADLWRNPELGDPPAPFIALKDTATKAPLLSGSSSTLADGNEHTMSVVAADDNVTMKLDGNLVFEGAHPLSPYQGFVTISAATGGSVNVHTVDSFTLRVGKTGPCAIPGP